MEDEFALEENWEPDERVTLELFRAWRAPRRGSANPERMTNPVWDWLVRTGITAYQASNHFKEPSAMEFGPGWCFHRFGQTSTELPDGRLIQVAGEHEDHYDPDFYIYNDVVVRHPDGRLESFGYPEDVFPPTDFQSATLVGEQIVLIGSLGYPDHRRPGITQVALLDTTTYAIRLVETSGASPGWLNRHTAAGSADGQSIVVRGGLVQERDEDGGQLVENIDDWELNLADWRWQRRTERHWPRRLLCREDGEMGNLMRLRLAAMMREVGQVFEHFDSDPERPSELDAPMAEMREMLPPEPAWSDEDFAVLESLYDPRVPHRTLPTQDDEYGVYRIEVDGTVVRFNENPGLITMTVEGELPEETIEAIASECLAKLTRLEHAPCEVRRR